MWNQIYKLAGHKGAGWNLRSLDAEGSLRFADFMACIAACAAVVFPDEDWQAAFVTIAQKLE